MTTTESRAAKAAKAEHDHAHMPQSPAAKSALNTLLEGNRRFVAGEPYYRRDITAARAAATEQHPIAAVFTCVDSRVTAESLFDCDFGHLIVVRTAGHVPDRAAVGSLAFAVSELDVSLVIVLGHERCGAIQLAVNSYRANPHGMTGNFLTDELHSMAAEGVEKSPDDPYHAAMLRQIDHTVVELRGDDQLAGAEVIGARYDLDHGTVRIVA
ncbi:carbonic anhydrase [Stackebrandtia endophytica]|uniref:Carbonic anhydrase n=1 Tax=Stackebrandtia endophytica TaxID=1496996 RepID=A0A543ARZ8_9ACTN|nr:carbonic anhydrase [Stackebrandtia endophytica]TQL75285.1 carbonic anhydrase [Stackebrandtia endophytica]